MRSFIVMAMFVASLSHAAWTDYQEARELRLPVDNIESLSIEAGAGSMDVTGIEGLDSIAVTATIVVPNTNEKDALKIIEEKMILSLEEKGRQGQLKAWFDQGFLGKASDAHIALEVMVPKGLTVHIDDGSGSLDVINVAGDVVIDDGSGSIKISNVINLSIDDGSGSIDIAGATGDVSIIDGSGSITVKHVQGSVTIDDGSGSIKVSDVEKDLIIVDDGSGGLSISNVRGEVDAES